MTNQNIFIVSLIAFVNMLGYGIVIPILYAYSNKFGLSDFDNGLLFATFSVCQFISTPIIGRLSDRFGRKPMLLVSIIGTALSFIMMAFAPNILFLFIARGLDGLTAGNIPVIFAVISDSTQQKDRARAFGKIGSAISLGFIFGPAISALTVGYGMSIPFIIATIITTIAVIITWIYLPETNTHLQETSHGKFFDFPKMWRTLFDPNVGATFLISLLFFLTFSCAIMYGFQPFTLNVLKLNQSQNASLFTLFGLVGFLTQNYLVGRYTTYFGTRKSFSSSILMTAVSLFILFISRSIFLFTISMVIMAIFNSIVQTLIPTILSAETDEKSQGSMMGLNSSYQSIGMIIGPIMGGAVATYHITMPFLTGGLIILICYRLTHLVLRPGIKKESAF